jgi:hypothetical protein
MKIDEVLTTAHESVSAGRVYAEPHQVDGVTVITAASVAAYLLTRGRRRRDRRT